MDCSLSGSSDHRDSPGKNTAVGCHALLQGIFPTQGSNPGLQHCRRILYILSHKGSPQILEWVDYPFSRGSSQPRNQTGVSCIAGEFFTSWAVRSREILSCKVPPTREVEMSLSDKLKCSSLAWKEKWKLADGSCFLKGKILAPKHGTQGCLGLDACMLSHLSCVWLLETLWTIPCQAPLSMEFFRNSPRILEWVAMPSSRGSSQTQRSNPHLRLLHCKQIIYHWATGEAPDDWILTLKFFFLNSAFFRVKGLLLILLPFLLNLNHTWLWVPPMMSPESVPTHSSGTPPPWSLSGSSLLLSKCWAKWHFVHLYIMALILLNCNFLCVCHHKNMWAPPNRSFFYSLKCHFPMVGKYERNECRV